MKDDDVEKQRKRIQRRKDLFASDNYMTGFDGKPRMKPSHRTKMMKDVPGPKKEAARAKLDKQESEYTQRWYKRKLNDMKKK